MPPAFMVASGAWISFRQLRIRVFRNQASHGWNPRSARASGTVTAGAAMRLKNLLPAAAAAEAGLAAFYP